MAVDHNVKDWDPMVYAGVVDRIGQLLFESTSIGDSTRWNFAAHEEEWNEGLQNTQ
jgi:hypothetical protein